jgi:opacity protein-like surface antigen
MKRNTLSFARRLLRGAALAFSFLAVISAPTLMAQDAGWSKSNYGFQLGVMVPMGELADLQEPGFGLAAFYEKVFPSGFATRGRLEYTMFGEKEYWGSGWSYSEQMTQVGVMLDLVWYKDLKDTVYPFVGIGYFSRSVSGDYQGSFGSASASEDLESEMAFCAGLGFNFTRNLGAELKYTQCEYNWVQLSLLYRF